MKDKIKVTRSSGNIYADLGLKDANEHLMKARMVFKIIQIIEERNLKQIEAAKIFGIKHFKISDLTKGRLDDFSIDRLILFLNKLDQDVKIIIKHKPKRAKRQGIFKVDSPTGFSSKNTKNKKKLSALTVL